MTRIIRYFSDVDMRQGHHGLTLLANKHGHDPRGLPVGEFLLFVNRAQTMFKMMTQNNVLLFYKSKRGKINPGIFALVPKYFSGREFDYDGALRETLFRDFKVKSYTTPALQKKLWKEMNV